MLWKAEYLKELHVGFSAICLSLITIVKIKTPSLKILLLLLFYYLRSDKSDRVCV